MDVEQVNRFWSHVDFGTDDECWEWTACKNKKGYGWFGGNRTSNRAHRVAWMIEYGPIPDGLWVCHSCDNPGCCNPAHLFLGDVQANVDDSVRKNRHTRGSMVGASKLTEDQVLDIRACLKAGASNRMMADKYHVNRCTIRDIKSRRYWAWL